MRVTASPRGLVLLQVYFAYNKTYRGVNSHGYPFILGSYLTRVTHEKQSRCLRMAVAHWYNAHEHVIYMPIPILYNEQVSYRP